MTTHARTNTRPHGRRSIRGIAVVAAACLALAGCSSDGSGERVTDDPIVSPAGGGGSLPDPCSLLTPAKIAAASGTEVADGVFNADLSTDSQSICEWKPSAGVFPIIQVIVSGGADQVSRQRATAESMMGAVVDVTVPGAHDAYAVAGGSILGMAVGDYFVQVAYMSSGTEDVLRMTTALAVDAAASL